MAIDGLGNWSRFLLRTLPEVNDHPIFNMVFAKLCYKNTHQKSNQQFPDKKGVGLTLELSFQHSKSNNDTADYSREHYAFAMIDSIGKTVFSCSFSRLPALSSDIICSSAKHCGPAWK